METHRACEESERIVAVQYTHLTHEEYKALEKQMMCFKETIHKTTGGFYHKSIRIMISDDLIMEFHGPLVGGYGHNEDIQIGRYEEQ